MNESQPIRDKGAEVPVLSESAPLTLRQNLDGGLAPLCMCQYCIDKRERKPRLIDTPGMPCLVVSILLAVGATVLAVISLMYGAGR